MKRVTTLLGDTAFILYMFLYDGSIHYVQFTPKQYEMIFVVVHFINMNCPKSSHLLLTL